MLWTDMMTNETAWTLKKEAEELEIWYGPFKNNTKGGASYSLINVCMIFFAVLIAIFSLAFVEFVPI